MANYREMLDQYEVLREEVAKFSPELGKRKFAIALTKIDAIDPEELNSKIEDFIKAIGLELSNENTFGFEKDKVYNMQDVVYSKFDQSKPFFVLPMSSVTKQNTKSVRFALYDLINIDK